MTNMFVIRGDGCIVRCASYQDVVAALSTAQAEHDKLASIVGVADWRTAEDEAGYTIGATEQEIEDSLSQLLSKIIPDERNLGRRGDLSRKTDLVRDCVNDARM